MRTVPAAVFAGVVRSGFVLGALCCVTLAPACRSQAEAEARLEAERVVGAVRALRDAENDDKAPRLAALRQVQCKTPDVCELRDVCIEAYRLYAAGHEAVRAVKKSLGNDGGADPMSSARLLERAEKDVRAGRERSVRCAELEGKVSGRYKLE